MPPLRRLAQDPGIKNKSINHQNPSPWNVIKETIHIPIPLPIYK